MCHITGTYVNISDTEQRLAPTVGITSLLYGLIFTCDFVILLNKFHSLSFSGCTLKLLLPYPQELNPTCYCYLLRLEGTAFRINIGFHSKDIYRIWQRTYVLPFFSICQLHNCLAHFCIVTKLLPVLASCLLSWQVLACWILTHNENNLLSSGNVLIVYGLSSSS